MVNVKRVFLRAAPVRGTIVLEGSVSELKKVDANLAKVSGTSASLDIIETEPGFGNLEINVSELNLLLTALGQGLVTVAGC